MSSSSSSSGISPHFEESTSNKLGPGKNGIVLDSFEAVVDAVDDAPPAAHVEKSFSSLTAFGLAFAVINSWVVLVIGLGSGLISGGPSALLWGFVYATVGNLATTLSHSEMFAVFPTAGGQYHWAAMLSAPRYKAVISWITGFCNVISLCLGTATVGYLCTTLLVTIAMVNGSSWAPTTGQEYAIFLALTVCGPAITLLIGTRANRWLDTFLMILSIGGALAIFITLLATSQPKASASFVFGGLYNATGWNSMVIAWLLGILQSAFAFIGFDLIYHISEEMAEPKKEGPKALNMCIIISGVSGFLILLACLFAIPDYDAVVGTEYPLAFAQICLNATGSTAATTVFLFIPLLLFMNSSRGICITSARVLMALGRDNVLPYSSAFQIIKFGEPIVGLIVTVVVAVVCGLVQLGSASAFSSLLGASTIFFQVTYAIPIAVMMLGGRKRLDNFAPRRGWNLGRWAVPCNIFALFFVLESAVVYCFPAALPVDASSMNYVIVFVGGFTLILSAIWFFWAKKNFHGPSEEQIWAISRGGKAPVVNEI